MTLKTITQLLFLYIFMLVLTATVTAATSGYKPTPEVYQFILKSTILWTGLVWVSVSVYITLISETDDFAVESWLSFIIGALMIYMGISGVFESNDWWLGVRTLLYLLLSISAVLMFKKIKWMAKLQHPDERLREVFSRERINDAFSRDFWRRR